jgi:hypothetical protein
MSGLVKNNFEAFRVAAYCLRQAGYEVMSPEEMHADTDHPWEFFLKHSIHAMLECDAVACLSDTHRSKGASWEIEIAQRLGMPVELVGWWLEHRRT